jgi:predicted nucleotidyltransferase
MERRSLHKSDAPRKCRLCYCRFMATDLTIPREFKRRALRAMPRRRIAKVILYGSRARGDARPDSDWDIAVFVRGRPTPRDWSTLAYISYDLQMETGAFIQAFPLPLRHANRKAGFHYNVSKDGVAV